VADLIRSCVSKKKYTTLGWASKALASQLEKGILTDRHQVYHCIYCSCYHIGRRPQVEKVIIIDKFKVDYIEEGYAYSAAAHKPPKTRGEKAKYTEGFYARINRGWEKVSHRGIETFRKDLTKCQVLIL
jgi:hypothetical protein